MEEAAQVFEQGHLLKEFKEYGPLVESQLRVWGEVIFFQKVTVRDKKGNVIREGERRVLANGEEPREVLVYDNRGIA